MALDLPIRRGLDQSRIGIVVGNRALGVAGISPQDVATDLSEENGSVSIVETGGSVFVVVLGGSDDALLRAARTFAGQLPHIGSLSGTDLSNIIDDLTEWAEVDSSTTGFSLQFSSVHLSTGDESVQLTATLEHDDHNLSNDLFSRIDVLARERATSTTVEADSTPLSYETISQLTVVFDNRRITIPTLSGPPEPGPIPGRPGAGAKNSLDLSNLFTKDGLLGDGDNNEIPDRVDALVIASADATHVPDLTARLGLESTGLTIPIVKRDSAVSDASKEPTSILVGFNHELIDDLSDEDKLELDSIASGHGVVELVPDALGSKPALVITGSDSAGAALAASRFTEIFPYVSEVGDDTPAFDDIEYELWGTLSGHTPAGQAALGLYKLDRLVEELIGEDIQSAHVLMSVEKPAAGLAEVVRERAASLTPNLSVTIDDRDVQRAATIFDEPLVISVRGRKFLVHLRCYRRPKHP